MNFIKYSITFKIFVVATVATTIFGIGAAIELGRVSFPPIFLMWWLHIVNMIPFPGRDNLVLESLIYAFTNIFHFVGAIVSLVVIKKYVGNGVFKKTGLAFRRGHSLAGGFFNLHNLALCRYVCESGTLTFAER
jgi:hypothetical protein